jgi:localization factor PodJL
MQPDLPWNVAGIPPEAREAARAAARREGLSVGEWLTRRILRSLTEGGEGSSWHRSPDYDYRGSGSSDYRGLSDEPSSTRDTDDMLARVSRSENEAQGAYRRIEDQLKGLAKRLEAAEKAQSESSKAMSDAATEINTATKEQAQAFDQLGSHVVGLGDRLARVERSAAADGVKDAVKGLHAGLSRLADQIAENTNQSASQIAKLAGNVESVAGKLNEVRTEAEQTARTLAARIASFDERWRTADGNSHAIAGKLDRTIAGIASFEERIRGAEAASQAVAGKLDRSIAGIASFEERIRSAESASQVIAEKLDRTIASMEASARSARADDQAELQRQAASIHQLSEALDKLSTRITASEAQTSGAMARLEHQIAESRQADQPFDRRLQGIEHALADIAGRMESAERSAAGSARTVEENLRNVSTRLDAADRRHRDAIAELQASVGAPVAPAPPAFAPATPPHAAAPSPPPIGDVFDLPPFPDTAPTFAPAPSDFPSFLSATQEFDPQADPLLLTQPAPTETADSYIAAARRSAKAAAAADTQPGMRGQLGGFSWGASTPSRPIESKSGGTARYLLVAVILLIAIAAVIGGILLSRGMIGNANAPMQTPPPRLHTETPSPVEQLAPPTAAPVAPAPQTHAPSTAPGSPVIPPQNVKKVEAKPAQQPPTLVQAHPAQPVPQPTKPSSPLERLSALASQGNGKAELLVGLKYLDGDGAPVNEAEAAKWLERASNQGEAIAAYRLGTLYERGLGVPADAAKAVQYYLAAARLGNRKAMHAAGVSYAQGVGTQKDLSQAAQWFSRAASLGFADSQFNLAVLYERGMGVQQSPIDAYKWYAIAAAQGDSESKARLQVLSTQLSPPELAAAKKAADEFRPLPVDRNANIPPDASSVG